MRIGPPVPLAADLIAKEWTLCSGIWRTQLRVVNPFPVKYIALASYFFRFISHRNEAWWICDCSRIRCGGELIYRGYREAYTPRARGAQAITSLPYNENQEGDSKETKQCADPPPSINSVHCRSCNRHGLQRISVQSTCNTWLVNYQTSSRLTEFQGIGMIITKREKQREWLVTNVGKIEMGWKGCHRELWGGHNR